MAAPRPAPRRAGIAAKPHVEEINSVVRLLVDWFEDRRIETWVEERFAGLLRPGEKSFPLHKPPRGLDLMVVLGGDGTLLSVARAMGSRQVPILGVNVGGLGFMTDVALRDLYPALEAILRGEYSLDHRMTLEAELVRKGVVVARQNVLNDVVITKGAIARIIEVGVVTNDQFVAMVRADGVIVSTPTGSTAYSLAAGGPIVFPGLHSMVLTPICPHTLTHRPVVVPSDALIELTLRSKSGEVYATFDGQESALMDYGDTVRVRKSRSSVKLILLAGTNFFQVLRQKLRWAERPRQRRSSLTEARSNAHRRS